MLEGADLRKLAPVKEGIIIIGNESKGISDAILARCSNRITIPRHGEAESLNAAVATGIILSILIGFFEVNKQKRSIFLYYDPLGIVH